MICARSLGTWSGGKLEVACTGMEDRGGGAALGIEAGGAGGSSRNLLGKPAFGLQPLPRLGSDAGSASPADASLRLEESTGGILIGIFAGASSGCDSIACRLKGELPMPP